MKRTRTVLLAIAATLLLIGIPIACCCGNEICQTICEHPLETLGTLAVLVGTAYQVKDASLIVTKALGDGATSVTSDGIQVKGATGPDFLAPCELYLEAPALTTTMLPDGETMTYIVQHDDDSAFGSVETLLDNVIVQTGAGSAGDAAATKRVKLPTDTKKYIRIKATKTGTGDCTSLSLTASLLF